MKYPLCHCMNVFPGITPKEKMRAFEEFLPVIRGKVPAVDGPFPAGLWLDAPTVSMLKKQHLEKDFAARIRDLGFYAYTANAFPYGVFHGTTVKTAVYHPDWTTQDRLEYTCAVADILALLLPEEQSGSISTLPGGYGPEFPETLWRDAAEHLLQAGDHLRRLYDRTGRRIRLAVEMEPDCAWESPREFLAFYDRYMRGDDRADWVGVCYDTCHQELLGDEPGAGYRLLQSAGVPIPKIQLSAALRAEGEASKERLAAEFTDGVYLHQTRIPSVSGGMEKKYADLPDALADRANRDRTWISHYHVPVFADEIAPGLYAEKKELHAVLEAWKAAPEGVNLELETYTYDVMPAHLKEGGREHAMAREMRYVLSILEGCEI